MYDYSTCAAGGRLAVKGVTHGRNRGSNGADDDIGYMCLELEIIETTNKLIRYVVGLQTDVDGLHTVRFEVERQCLPSIGGGGGALVVVNVNVCLVARVAGDAGTICVGVERVGDVE